MYTFKFVSFFCVWFFFRRQTVNQLTLSLLSCLLFHGTYLHGNRQFCLNIYRLYLKLEEKNSKQSGAYALLFGRCWAGAHLGRLRFFGARIWSGVSWFLWQSVEVRLDRYPRATRSRPPGSNPPWRGYVHRLAPEAPLYWRMPTEPEEFWGMLGMSGLRPCARTHLKKRPCAIVFRLVGRKTNSDNLQAEWSVCTSLWEELD